MGHDSALTGAAPCSPEPPQMREPRAVCLECLRPRAVCCCAHIETLDTRTKVLILQHPRERKVGVNTARMAHQCLPNSVLRVGVDFGPDQVVRAMLRDPERPAAVLFPGENAVDVVANPPQRPVTLVVLDGTWWQAAKLLRANPEIAALPRWGLTLTETSRYRIRRQPAEHCVSTVEALAAVLGVLEQDPARMQRLLVPFERMVQAQLDYAKQSGGASRHARPGPQGELRPWQVLLRRPERVILAAGETNEWPRHAREGLPEIVHWVAVRPASGARFEAVVRPAQRLAPSCPVQVGLPADCIVAGETFDQFQRRWAAFAGQGDTVCTWGRHAGDVAARQGLSLEPRLDVRAFTIKHLGRRAGEMPDYAQALGASVATPWARGRAGQRLAALEGIAARLTDRVGR